MKNSRFLLMILIVFFGITGSCSSTVSEKNESALPELDFSSELVSPGPVSPPDLMAAGGVGNIIARGAIGTPYPCFEITGQAERDGWQITLRITATRKEVICTAVVAAFGYDAKIPGLETGTYLFRIEHTFAKSTKINTVFEQVVHVL